MAKHVLFRKVSAIFLTLSLALCTCVTCAFAEELPVEIPGPGEATVSDEVDKADNYDPNMGTQFYMYIPPDVVANDYPQMSDTGIATQWLLLGALVCGLGYLGATAYAANKEKTLGT